MVNGKSVYKGHRCLLEKTKAKTKESGRIYVVSYTKASGVKIGAINMKNKRKSTTNKRQQGMNDDDDDNDGKQQQQQPTTTIKNRLGKGKSSQWHK